MAKVRDIVRISIRTDADSTYLSRFYAQRQR